MDTRDPYMNPRYLTAAETAARTPEQMYQLQRKYLEAVQPWLQMQANIMGLQPVRYVMGAGIWEREILWDPECKKTYDLISTVMAEIGRSIMGGGR